MGLCLLRSLMAFQREIPGSKLPSNYGLIELYLMEGSDGI